MNRSTKECVLGLWGPLLAGLLVFLSSGGLAVRADAARHNHTGGASAPAEQQVDAQQQVATARRQHERARRRAVAAGADVFAPDLIGEADRQASEAEAALRRNDFEQARAGYQAATTSIEQAVARTAAAAEAARVETETARRAVVHSVAAAESEVEKASNFERRGRHNDARLAYQAATSLYEAATGTEGAMVDADVFAVLQQYETAMEGEDLDAFKSLWIEIDEVQEHRVKQSFEWFDSIQIDYSETNLVELSDEFAVVTSVQRTEWVAAESGEAIATDNRVTFNLRKRDTAWLIESLSMEAVR